MAITYQKKKNPKLDYHTLVCIDYPKEFANDDKLLRIFSIVIGKNVALHSNSNAKKFKIEVVDRAFKPGGGQLLFHRKEDSEKCLNAFVEYAVEKINVANIIEPALRKLSEKYR